MQLEKYEKNPVLAPNPARSWESLVATNPGAWYDEEKGEVLMLYRAAGEDTEHRVNLALAVSKNGYDFHRVSEQPLFAQTPAAGTAAVSRTRALLKWTAGILSPTRRCHARLAATG